MRTSSLSWTENYFTPYPHSTQTLVRTLRESLASATLATFPKGHAKVPALAPGAVCLKGDVSGSSCMGEGLRKMRVPLATRSIGRGQPTGRQDSSWLSLSRAMAGVPSSLSRRRDTVAAPALCFLSLPTVHLEDMPHVLLTVEEPSADHGAQTRLQSWSQI